MAVEEVRTVDIQGRTFVLPEGVDVQVKFADGHGGLHDTPEEAGKTKAINDAEEIVKGCVDWRNEEFDTQHMLDERHCIIEALQAIDGKRGFSVDELAALRDVVGYADEDLQNWSPADPEELQSWEGREASIKVAREALDREAPQA